MINALGSCALSQAFLPLLPPAACRLLCLPHCKDPVMSEPPQAGTHRLSGTTCRFFNGPTDRAVVSSSYPLCTQVHLVGTCQHYCSLVAAGRRAAPLQPNVACFACSLSEESPDTIPSGCDGLKAARCDHMPSFTTHPTAAGAQRCRARWRHLLPSRAEGAWASFRRALRASLQGKNYTVVLVGPQRAPASAGRPPAAHCAHFLSL